MRRTYTDRERAAALLLLRTNGGNIKRTARELGLPRKTVCTWSQGRGISEEVKRMSEDPEVRKELAGKFKQTANRALDALTDEKLAGASAKDLALVAGIATDKSELLQGRATQVTVHRVSVAVIHTYQKLLEFGRPPDEAKQIIASRFRLAPAQVEELERRKDEIPAEELERQKERFFSGERA
jgi:transposase-like protein